MGASPDLRQVPVFTNGHWGGGHPVQEYTGLFSGWHEPRYRQAGGGAVPSGFTREGLSAEVAASTELYRYIGIHQAAAVDVCL